jgi:hypothetical protein
VVRARIGHDCGTLADIFIAHARSGDLQVRLTGTVAARSGHGRGTLVDCIRRLECELIEDGLLRRIDFGELPPRLPDVTREKFSALGLVEITSIGRRRLAGWLGLRPAAASRYHGLVGNGRRDTGRRWRMLRTLAHTLGANGVFVQFAVAADAVRRHGGSDVLAE